MDNPEIGITSKAAATATWLIEPGRHSQIDMNFFALYFSLAFFFFPLSASFGVWGFRLGSAKYTRVDYGERKREERPFYSYSIFKFHEILGSILFAFEQGIETK